MLQKTLCAICDDCANPFCAICTSRNQIIIREGLQKKGEVWSFAIPGGGGGGSPRVVKKSYCFLEQYFSESM